MQQRRHAMAFFSWLLKAPKAVRGAGKGAATGHWHRRWEASDGVSPMAPRISRQIQRLLVLNDFPRSLQDKLVTFYRSSPFHNHCSSFVHRLNFFPWDHCLLAQVLRGLNTTGKMFNKRKRWLRIEDLNVIEARVERMDKERRYKELVRYLKVVQCRDLGRALRDKIPFYLRKTGCMDAAAQALIASYHLLCCAVCRLSPSQFEDYLKIFWTGQAPRRTEVAGSAVRFFAGRPMKLQFLITWICTLRRSISTALYRNPKLWSAIIRTLSSPPKLVSGQLMPATFEEPPQVFQHMVFLDSCRYLESFGTQNQPEDLPTGSFADDKHPAAGLIFVAQAVRQMVLAEYHSMDSFLDIVLAFGGNFWALDLLLDSLAEHEEVLSAIVGVTVDDLFGRKTEMLELWQKLGPRYVGEMLSLFLTSEVENIFGRPRRPRYSQRKPPAVPMG